MTDSYPPFFETPILNSPYEEPSRHHALDAEGQPLNEPPREGRRKSEFITPVPKPRKKKSDARQGKVDDALSDRKDLALAMLDTKSTAATIMRHNLRE